MLKVNPKIKLLTLADVFSLYGINLLSPIFSVFVVEKVKGGSLTGVGIAMGINLFMTEILALLMALYFDKTKGNRDEYNFLLLGYFGLAVLPLFYIWVSKMWQVYLLQFLSGSFAALGYSAWRGLYARSVDRGRESFEWTFNAAANGLVAASAAFVSGFLADKFGYNYVFLVSPFIGLFGIISILKAKKYFPV